MSQPRAVPDERPATTVWRGPGWPAVVVFWTALGLLECLTAPFRASLARRPIGLTEALINNLPWWLLWAPLTAIPVALSRRFPLQGPRWRRSVLAHVAGALLTTTIHLLSEGAVYYFTTGGRYAPSLRWQWTGFFANYTMLDLVTYGLIVGACHALEFHGRFRDAQLRAALLEAQRTRLELGLSEARLQALRLELNPHFFFNALNSVSGLVRRGESDAAVRMLARLGELLSATLDHDRPPQIPLREELDLLDRYLDIERVRFGDRLSVTVRVEPGAASALVPTFFLQPLVENSIRHGIARRSGTARIEVTARVDGRTLHVDVSDSGEGVRIGAREGIGLSNPRARLTELYGDSATVSLENGAAGGGLARIALPFRSTASEAR